MKCKAGEQQLIFYTKEKVDSLLGSLNFLTETQADARYLGIGAQAADSDQLDGMDSSEFLGVFDQATDSDKLDGKDSSEFVTTNCIGFPHVRVDWHGCDLRGANLTGANLSLADLTNANLSVADLTYANLSVADLTNANLSVADLANANLSLADLTNAALDHVSWAHTTCPDGTNSDDNGGTCVGHL